MTTAPTTTWKLNVSAITGHKVDCLGPLGAGGLCVLSEEEHGRFIASEERRAALSHYVYRQDGKGLKVASGPHATRELAMLRAQVDYIYGREVIDRRTNTVVEWQPTLIKARNACRRREHAAESCCFVHRGAQFVGEGDALRTVCNLVVGLAQAIERHSLPARIERARQDVVANAAACAQAEQSLLRAQRLLSDLEAEQAQGGDHE